MNEILTKLKDSVNIELLGKFDAQVLEQMRFLPINIKERCIYIAINPFANKDEIAELIKKTNKDFETKFVQISEDEIEELLETFLSSKHEEKNVKSLSDETFIK